VEVSQDELSSMKLLVQSVLRRAGRSGFYSRQGQDSSILHNFQTGSGTHSASYPMGMGGYSGVKQPEPDGNHQPPSSAEVKNAGGIPPFPHISSWHST
jgi:hypothetical protein